jgi:hypothetical protein
MRKRKMRSRSVRRLSVSGAGRKGWIMRRLLVVSLLVAVLSAGFSAPARAHGGVITGGGTYTLGNIIITSSKQVGDNTVLTFTFTQVSTGLLAGSCTGVMNPYVIHPDGRYTGQGVTTCTGVTVAGVLGSYTEDYGSRGLADGSSINSRGVIRGMGGLEDLHGTYTLQGSSASGTYTARVHFDR